VRAGSSVWRAQSPVHLVAPCWEQAVVKHRWRSRHPANPAFEPAGGKAQGRDQCSASLETKRPWGQCLALQSLASHAGLSKSAADAPGRGFSLLGCWDGDQAEGHKDGDSGAFGAIGQGLCDVVGRSGEISGYDHGQGQRGHSRPMRLGTTLSFASFLIELIPC